MNGAGSGQSWEDFTTLLVDVLRELTVGEILRLETPDAVPVGGPASSARAYVIRHTRHRARVAVGGSLGPGLRHDARLARAGWHPPSPWAGPDHYIDGDFAAVDQLAASLVSAFREVWCLAGPGTVRWTGRGSETYAPMQEPGIHQLGA